MNRLLLSPGRIVPVAKNANASRSQQRRTIIYVSKRCIRSQFNEHLHQGKITCLTCQQERRRVGSIQLSSIGVFFAMLAVHLSTSGDKLSDKLK